MITLSEYGESRIEIKKSVFIGRAVRIRSAQEAEAFVNEARNTYPDARHCCYAWTYDGQTQMRKYSDDGEPSGTAGMPMLSMIDKNGFMNVAVTVTRYFGGILLGKGGLVRAYTEATIAALEAAGPVRTEVGEAYRADCPYAMSDKLTYLMETNGWQIEDIQYGSDVGITYVCQKTDSAKMIAAVTDKTAGKISPVLIGEREIMIERFSLKE